LCVGRIGERFSAEEGYGQARQVGLQMLSILTSALDSLDRVERVVKLTAFIHSTLDFTDHARVANGCSDLVAEVFGASGRHARSTVGVSTLPAHVPLEIEAIFQVR
jgi:enamine deaminase RidA (YjgF/YER057c/UK114 family)